MAASCSFILETNKTKRKLKKNRVCFAEVWQDDWIEGERVPQTVTHFTIVIEEEKWYKTKEKTIEFLEDLKEMGFRIKIKPKMREIHVQVLFQAKRNPKTIWFVQSVRALWESKYENESGNYTKLVDEYFRLKDMNLPYNKLELFCLAHSTLEIKGEIDRWERGHYSVYRRNICKIPNLNSMAHSKQYCLDILSVQYPDEWKGQEVTKELIEKLYKHTCQKQTHTS